MEREAWLELGEHRCRGAGGEGRPVRGRGESRLRGELGGAQSRGLKSQPRREGGWQRPGGGPGADAEQGRPALRGTGGSKCGRPFFKALMRRKQRLKRSAGGRGRPGRSLGLGRARGRAARAFALRPGRAQGEERAAPPSSHVPGAVGQRRRSANRCPSGSLLSAAGLALCPLRWGFCCSNWSPVFREQEGREAPRGGNACVGRASLGHEPRAGGGAFDINKSTADVKRGAFKQTLTSIVTRGRGHLTPYLPRGRRWVVGIR